MKLLLAAALLGWSLFVQLAQADEAPKYLQLAREFVANTQQANNGYSNSKVFTRMPTDSLGTEYVVSTDCSGFVADMFRRAGGDVLAQLKTLKPRSRPLTPDFHASIQGQEAFRKITQVQDMQIGDVAVWQYLNAAGHQLPGHILFIDSVPVKIEPRNPIVEGLDQYEFALIDASQEAKSRDDTRYVSDPGLRAANRAKGKERGTMASPNHKGVGRGHMRFYADREGNIKGAAFGFSPAKFHANGADWDIVVGRPKVDR
jgi:hypothetical protein